MGIKGLDNILKEHCKTKGIRSCRLQELNGKRVCVDISELIYKSIRKNKEAHVAGILNLIELFSNWNIKPLIVFDGKSVSAKNKVNQSRSNKREKAHQRKLSLTQQLDFANEIADTLNNDDVIIINNNSDSSSSAPSSPSSDTEISRSSSCVSLSSLSNFDNLCISSDYNPDDKSSIMAHLNTIKDTLEKAVSKADNKSQGISHKKINEIKQLLEYFGIPFIHNKKYEADIICSYLVKNNIVEYCISNDMDMLTFGCYKVIRNLSFTSDLIDIYDLNNILSELEITHSQFIDLCILMGCDYTGKMYNMKSNLPLKLIKKYGTIENIIDNLEKINKNIEKEIVYNDYFNYNTAREVFNMSFDDAEINNINESIDFQKMEIVKNELTTNVDNLKQLFNYCQEKCPSLNNYLITNKINSFMGINQFKKYTKKLNLNNNEDYIIKQSYKYQQPQHFNRQYQSRYINDIKNDIKSKSINQIFINRKHYPHTRQHKSNSNLITN